MRTLLVGHGGREAALARRISESSTLFGYLGHLNPTICELVHMTGGAYQTGDVCAGKDIARFAVAHAIDLALVASDDPLAAGVVDELMARKIPTVGPTRAGAEIEWNKEFCRRVVEQVAPEANPVFAIARTVGEVAAAVDRVAPDGGPVVVKPVGLAAGKGVKVVGPHLRDNGEAETYARSVITTGHHGGAVVIEERITSPEFTIQAMTDGHTVVFPPATYDYPYRFEGDTGPGTGGMGSCSDAGGLLPFLSRQTYDEACGVVQDVVHYLTARGRHFTGCLNAGFFATDKGLRVIEFNARFGDPEGINIMALLEGDWCAAMQAMWSGTLEREQLALADEASVVTYLVAPGYALCPAEPTPFRFDLAKAKETGADVLFSAAVECGPKEYQTVGTSRVLAVVSRGPTLDLARTIVREAIGVGFGGEADPALQWRRDIGVLPGR